MLVVDAESDLLAQLSCHDALQFCREQGFIDISRMSFSINLGEFVGRGNMLADLNNGGTHLFIFRLLHIAVKCGASMGVGLRSINAFIPSGWILNITWIKPTQVFLHVLYRLCIFIENWVMNGLKLIAWLQWGGIWCDALKRQVYIGCRI